METRTINVVGIIGALAMAVSVVATATRGAVPTTPPSSLGLVSTNGAGPRIQFASQVSDFGKVTGGQAAECKFVFTNIGDRLLEVSKVRISCGCLKAGEWSQRVEPGKTGTIPIEVTTQDLDGAVAKTVAITCNDTHQPGSILLQVKGTVWWPIKVTPRSAFLNVLAEAPSNAPSVVRIISNLDEPLTLSEPECSNPAFAIELKTIQPGKEFQLVIQAKPPFDPDNFKGLITLKTSSKQTPSITVSAFALVQEAVTVLPALIALPPGPLRNQMPFTISIRNNGTNMLAVTEPTLNAPGVDLKLQEVQPGRFYSVQLVFPQGFELAQGEKVELNLKSNHPQFPVITVPVIRWRLPASP